MSQIFKIVTLGCKVNQYESAYLKEVLAREGWRQARGNEIPDMTIINTCIVTQRASHQSRQAIRKAIRENPRGRVAAVGCYAQVFPDELSSISGIDLIAGNMEKGVLPGFLLDGPHSKPGALLVKDFESHMPFEPLPIKRFPDRSRAYLKIQDGCESFCSYCIVPFARGPYRSLPPSRVLSMLETFSQEEYGEVVLTGIHLGKYGVDLEAGMNLTRLLRDIGKHGFPIRIRLSSLEPNEIDRELVEMVASQSWLCRHFHIPLQSGDDRVLGRMNRPYRARAFARLIETIHAMVPYPAIGVDVMSGFPDEDQAAHENTCSLIRDLPVSYLHVFPYSSRPGTAAADFDGPVHPDIIKERAAELRDLGKTKKDAFYESCLELEFLVLGERRHPQDKRVMEGRSDNYLPVLFESREDATGRLISLRMERVDEGWVIGSSHREVGTV
jgi:threonylcarbamoyladenosine tRNA methylthiotransferase MtaB